MTIQELLVPLQEILKTLLGIVKSYPIIIIAFSWIAALLFVNLKSKSPDALFSQEYFNFIIIGLPILYIVITGLRLGSTLNDKTKVAKLVGLAVLFIGLISGTWYLNTSHGTAEPILTSDIAEKIMFFLNIIGVAIIVFGLIIFARLLKDVAYSFEGWIGIIMRVIFFIPCMLSDLLSYIGGEFARSPFVVYVLIAIEAMLIFAYLYLPKIISKLAVAPEGDIIVNNPVSLGEQKSLKSIGNLYIKDGIKPDLGSYNKFSISMWFYIKSMPSNTYPYNEDAIILNLENHPKVVYNGSKNKCIVYLNKTSHEFKIPLQKWVNLVVVFGKEDIDIFLDGQLTKTAKRDGSTKLAYSDTIIVGQDSGLQGKIANISYYKKAMSKLEITQLYELNRNKDPPINYNDNIYDAHPQGKSKTNKRKTRKNRNANYVVAIPSFRRSDIITQKTLVTLRKGGIPTKSIYIFVANSAEYDSYKKVAPNIKIVIGVKGIMEQPKFIVKYFPEGTHIVSMDDDVEKFLRLSRDGQHLIDFKKGELDRFIRKAFEAIEAKGLFIWGIYPMRYAYYMKHNVTTDLRLILGTAYGFICRHDADLLPSVSEKEDYETTIKYFLKDGGVMRFNDICLKTIYHSPGGLGKLTEDRLKINEIAAKQLQKMYPELITVFKRPNGMTEVRLV